MIINRTIFDVNLLNMGTTLGAVYALSKGAARWGHRIIKQDLDLLFVSTVSYIFNTAICKTLNAIVGTRTSKEEEGKRHIMFSAFFVSIPLGLQVGTAVHHFCYPHTKISLSFKDNCLLSVIMVASYWISGKIAENIW